MSKSAGGVRAGKAYIELGVRNEISEGLRKAEQRVKLFGEKIKEVGSAVAMVGAAVAAFGGAIVGMAAAGVAAFTKIAGDFSDLAAQTGLSVELMTELETALKDAGSTVEEFSNSVVKLRRFISEAAQGSKGAAEALGRLGLSAEDLIDLSADEQFLRIADALSKVKNPTDRLTLAMKLFGESAFKMLPVLEAGGAGIEEFRAKARALGFSLSGETADAADALGTQLEILQDQFGRIAVAIGEALLPAASAFVGIMQTIVGRVIEFIRSNGALVVGVTLAGAALLALGTAVGVVGAVIVTVGATVAAMGPILGALSVAIGAILSPLGLVIAAIAAVGGLALWATGAFGEVWDIGVESAQSVATAWEGVSDALAAGDYGLAGEIAMKAVEAAFRRGLADIVQRVVMPFVGAVANILSNIPGVGDTFSEWAEGLALAQNIVGLNLFGASDAESELEDLKKRAKEARREVEGRTPDAIPFDSTAPDIVAPALAAPEIEAPSVPQMESVQQEIATRMSAMGGFNAAALGGMFGGPDEMVEQQKRSNDFLAKLLEQGKRSRDSLVWS
jgi:archaellum component FlaC